MADPILGAVRRLKSGTQVEETSRALAEQLRPRLFSYFRHRRFSDADAQDLVQETFRRVFQGIGGLDDVDCFMGWLFRIARNVALTASSAAGRAATESLDGPIGPVELPDVSAPTPLQALLSAERLDRVWDGVQALSHQQRQCLLMRAVHEMSYEEIATVLRLSIRTVRNHLREARLRLRQDLGER